MPFIHASKAIVTGSIEEEKKKRVQISHSYSLLNVTDYVMYKL